MSILIKKKKKVVCSLYIHSPNITVTPTLESQGTMNQRNDETFSKCVPCAFVT